MGLKIPRPQGHAGSTPAPGTKVRNTVQAQFDTLENALVKKYGARKKFDYAVGLMDDPKYWMIALKEKNRSLSAFWDREEKSTLPADLPAIALSANATDLSTGYVNLDYEFSNFADCNEESVADRDRAL